jgi:hypothetical protein
MLAHDRRMMPYPRARLLTYAALVSEELPRCKCGHDRHHYMVSAVPIYNWWKLFVVSMGISQKPERIDYHCRRCDKTFDTTDEISEYAQDDR